MVCYYGAARNSTCTDYRDVMPHARFEESIGQKYITKLEGAGRQFTYLEKTNQSPVLYQTALFSHHPRLIHPQVHWSRNLRFYACW